VVLIAWRPEFETGIPDVDHEHRELVGLINQLHAALEAGASKDEVARFLGEVFARISAHFALEESIMRKHRYDEYAEHKADHEKLLDDIRARGGCLFRLPGCARERGARLVRRAFQDQRRPPAQKARDLKGRR